MKEVVSEFLDEIYLSLKYSLRDITLFPGDNLIYSFKIAAGITVISALCALLDLPRFVEWKGALLGTVILGVLILIGRRRDNALSGADGVGNDSTRVHAGWEEGAGSKEQT